MSNQDIEIKYNTTFEGRTNLRQEEFSQHFWNRIKNKNKYNVILYGGAIRGGKTAVCIANMIVFCLTYKNARVHFVRASYTNLKKTVLESFGQFVPKNRIKKCQIPQVICFAYSIMVAKSFSWQNRLQPTQNTNVFWGLKVI